MSAKDQPRQQPANQPSRTRLGLPTAGPGSLAPMNPRLLGLAIDWGIAVLFAAAWFNYEPFVVLGIYALLHIVFVPTLAGSPGHLVARLAVQKVEGGAPGLLRSIVRTLLLCLVIPAVVWDEDGRGLHDRLAKTVLVRR